MMDRSRCSRRAVLEGIGALTLAGSAGSSWAAGPPAAAAMPGGAAPATDIRSEFRMLAPNVYAFLQREAPGQSNFSVSNFGIVAGPQSLLAIDAGGGPQHARNFIAAAKVLGKPFDRIIITHEHPDHIVGLTQFPAGIEIVSQEATREQMVKMGQPATPAYWATNPAWGNARDVNRVILPTVTFTDRMSVFYGDTRVDFVWPGRAHTSGDVLIRVPQARVVFLGDIGFFGVTPLNGSGFVADWIKVCDRLLADPDAQTLVPGHGPVGGKAELKDMRDYLALLLREGRRSFDAGVSAGRAAAQLDLGHYATWTDADRVATNMARLYSEFRGTIGPDMDRNLAREAVEEYNRLKRRS
ncbi:MAG TPA: MBL fold metallo-hydrolase [Steroidobacteraceae bacterium]|nr:MBL fold metallo-hydrolase [Steroidobacteraceae bacterium]